MKGLSRMTETELKAVVHRACSIAEDAGVHVALIRDFFQGCHTQYTQRALFVADQANATRMHDSRGVPINHHANVARSQAIREEKRRLADEAAYRADLDRRCEADKISRVNRRWLAQYLF
jgi:hypothetical protein